MRIGLVGYGTGGRHFHAPFMAAARNVELTGVVARAPETIAAVNADMPEMKVFPSLQAMIEAGEVDAVTITTPPQTRCVLVLQAIKAGLHVIADKPFAPNAQGASELEAAARNRGVILGVFQNRRWDSNFQTLYKLIEVGRLGKIWSVHSRMDFNDPATLEAGPEGGLLRDLGSHLVDQMLWLLGPVTSVDAQLDHVKLETGVTDTAFTITLRHASGAHSHISASKLNHINCRELRAYGELGSYVSVGTDVQAQAIFAGRRPNDDLAAWGFEPQSNWGVLRTSEGTQEIPAEQGRYHDYYEAFAEAAHAGAEPPVTAVSGIRTLEVLDAARRSALEGRSVSVVSKSASEY